MPSSLRVQGLSAPNPRSEAPTSAKAAFSALEAFFHRPSPANDRKEPATDESSLPGPHMLLRAAQRWISRRTPRHSTATASLGLDAFCSRLSATTFAKGAARLANAAFLVFKRFCKRLSDGCFEKQRAPLIIRESLPNRHWARKTRKEPQRPMASPLSPSVIMPCAIVVPYAPENLEGKEKGAGELGMSVTGSFVS